MELTQLRYFYAVAQSQHMTKTAKTLHIAQPALSQSIRRLEGELGVPLVEPRGRGIGLTDYGKHLYARLGPVLSTLDHIPRELSAMAETVSNTIHMNMLAASTVITSSIIAYGHLNEHVKFQLFQSHELEVCDIEVSTRLFYQQGQKDTYILTEEIYLAVPNKPPYAGRESITLAEVANEEFVCMAGASQFRTICDAFCQHAGFLPQVAFESDAPGTVRNFIAAGLGVGFWPQCSWGYLGGDDVLLLPITDSQCQRDLVIRYSPREQNNQVAEHYFHFLVDYLEGLKPQI